MPAQRKQPEFCSFGCRQYPVLRDGKTVLLVAVQPDCPTHGVEWPQFSMSSSLNEGGVLLSLRTSKKQAHL